MAKKDFAEVEGPNGETVKAEKPVDYLELAAIEQVLKTGKPVIVKGNEDGTIEIEPEIP